MTTGQKWLSLLLLQAGLLGGAYAGGRYPEWKKRQEVEEAAFKKYEKLQAESTQMVLGTRARAVMMEAALAARYGNFAMAFDRVVRAQSAIQRLKLTTLEKDFDEISGMLIAQKPEVWEKILAVADKIEAPTPLTAPDPGAVTKPTAAFKPAPGASAPTAPTTPAATGPAVSPPRPVAPATPTAVVPTAPTAAPTPIATSPAAPSRSGSPDNSIEQGRSSLLAAKELLIVGTEPSQVIAKIAHAQVLLEEGGHAEFAEQFGAAIKALRAHEETKARTTLDGVLTSLRGL